LTNLRKYGDPPYRAVVAHGGPGAVGSMAMVAQELSSVTGILEPLLTSKSINGQLEELRTIIKDLADIPVLLACHSWGAWLVYIFAAHYPVMAKKIILIGSYQRLQDDIVKKLRA
jgi:pimeloyl-ACP methyl ester carboxylesterase